MKKTKDTASCGSYSILINLLRDGLLQANMFSYKLGSIELKHNIQGLG